MRFVEIMIDGVTSLSGESEHQFWDNCSERMNQSYHCLYYFHLFHYS